MMIRTHGVLVLAIVVALVLGGCGGDDDLPTFDPNNFVTTVNNPFFPLVPGTTYTYQGVDDEGGAETVVVVVTAQTKQILGVTTTVVRDTVTVDDELIEDTQDWFAQDRQGNVWYLGEDVKNFEGGVLVDTAGSWEAGVNGASPGIIMLADPEVGQVYRQEFAEGVAEDFGKVLDLDGSIRVPFGSFTGALITKDYTPLEPGVVEHKYYARGVGNVFTKKVEGGTGSTRLITVTGP